MLQSHFICIVTAAIVLWQLFLPSKITLDLNVQCLLSVRGDAQQRWTTIEKEAYAIVWALTKLKEVIIGSKIHTFTDHNPLTYLTE